MHFHNRWFVVSFAVVLLIAGTFSLAYTYAQTVNATSKTVIAFGSDADQDKPQPLWDTILGAKPDIFLFLGDNVQLNTANENVMRKKYSKLAAMPGYIKLMASHIPIFATWDDHDYGADDAGADLPQKDISKKVFLDFFEEPANSLRRTHGGIYDSKIIGEDGKRVQLIALDLRYFRSSLKKSSNGNGYISNEDPSATILGTEQWEWLQNELKKPAEVRIIMSSIQVITRNNGWENWMNFPLERAKLFKMIKDTKANGVIFISGDRHYAGLSMMDGGIGYPIYDLTTGSLNKAPKPFIPEKNIYRTVAPESSENWGLVSIDWGSPEQATWITLEARDIDNNPVLHKRFPLGLLKQGVVNYLFKAV